VEFSKKRRAFLVCLGQAPENKNGKGCWQMKIEQREQGMAAILEGELGHREALEAMRSLEDAIDSYAPSSLELDFSGVSFMDSSGIAVVVQAARQMQAAGGSLAVSGASRQAMRVFSAAGVPRLVRFIGWEEKK
jgi:stage II sporulation protein AA (anti-sigma F factor antagonist)